MPNSRHRVHESPFNGDPLFTSADARRMPQRDFWMKASEELGHSPESAITAWLMYETSRAKTNGQSVFGRSYMDTLRSRGLRPPDLARFAAFRHNLPMVEDATVRVDKEWLAFLGEDLCKRCFAVPISTRRDGAPQRIALGDPDVENLPALKAKVSQRGLADYVVASITAVQNALSGDHTELTETLARVVVDQPDAAMIERDLEEAFRRRASDMHIESTEGGLVVRVRIDGSLDEFRRLNVEQRKAYIAQIRLSSSRSEDGITLRSSEEAAAKMNIGVDTLPEDANAMRNWNGVRVALRYSGAPSAWGYSIVIRFIDQTRILGTRLSDLGYRASTEQTMISAFRGSTSLNLLLGTTGSGKTTTLYSGIKAIDLAHNKVITIEDPIECRFPEGVTQWQVTTQFTFSMTIKAALRQDPDALIVAEVRDAESFLAMSKYASSGHCVWSTLHVDTPHLAVQRLLGILRSGNDSSQDVAAASFANFINVLCAQRLGRRLCPKCKVVHPDNARLAKEHEQLLTEFAGDVRDLREDDARKFGLPNDPATATALKAAMQAYGQPQFCKKGPGCPACDNRGERDRIVFAECYKFDEADCARVIAEGSNYNARAARQDARKRPKDRLITQREDALIKAAAGLTSPETVFDITDE